MMDILDFTGVDTSKAKKVKVNQKRGQMLADLFFKTGPPDNS
jgi:hypothetical protein